MRPLLAVAAVLALTTPAHAQDAAPALPPTTPPDLAGWLRASGLLIDHDLDDSINPFYLRGDFNGDGRADYVVSLRERAPKGSSAAGGTKEYALLAPRSKKGKAAIAPFPHPDTPARDGWYVHDRSAKVEVGVTGGKPPRLQGDAVMMWKAESSSALIYWNGKKLVTYWQSD